MDFKIQRAIVSNIHEIATRYQRVVVVLSPRVYQAFIYAVFPLILACAHSRHEHLLN